MAQELNWTVGDRYKTDNGMEVEIISVGSVILGKADDNVYAHAFDYEGKAVCPCANTHHGLRSRVVGPA